MNKVQARQWDITDIYESDLYGGDLVQDLMYVRTHLEEGEVVQIRELEKTKIPDDLQQEIEDLEDYDGSERVFLATVSYTGAAGNVRINATGYWKETIPETGLISILVLEDTTSAGRPRKKKRTSTAVTDVKPIP